MDNHSTNSAYGGFGAHAGHRGQPAPGEQQQQQQYVGAYGDSHARVRSPPLVEHRLDTPGSRGSGFSGVHGPREWSARTGSYVEDELKTVLRSL